MKIFSEDAICKRKQKVSSALDQVLSEIDIVLVFSGAPISKPGGHDQTYPFLPHPDYLWLTGIRRPYGVSAYSKKDGWIDFIRPITREERIWEGGGEEIPGKDLQDFDSWIKSKGSKGNAQRIFLLGQFHQYLHLSTLKEEERIIIQELFNDVRRIKDEEEIQLIDRVATIASVGYKKLKEIIRPGLTERQIQIEYEAEVLRAGAEKLPYETIVGTGTNSAILHAIPTARVVQKGEHVLIDAGADLDDYCVDITRVFSSGGSFDQRQKSIYEIVKKAQEQSIQLCRPNVEWKEVHLCSARIMAEGLYDLGLLKIGPEEALEAGVTGVFFPHGVGHMVGLRVRDVGGPPNPHPKKYGGSKLRVDMPLKAGFMMTVEPGLYFIPALLDDEETRRTFKDQINWNEVEKWKDFGGVRLEDDILITEGGPRNLTSMIEK